jgi:hypothetical protein
VGAGPEDGCYIRGLYMEGARWDSTQHLLSDSRPKELFTDCPIVRLMHGRLMHVRLPHCDAIVKTDMAVQYVCRLSKG